MIIDYVNIVLCAAVAVMAVVILFLRSNSGILCPAIFAPGGPVNLLSGLKKILTRNMVPGWVLIGAAAVIYVLAFLCLGVVR